MLISKSIGVRGYNRYSGKICHKLKLKGKKLLVYRSKLLAIEYGCSIAELHGAPPGNTEFARKILRLLDD